MLCWDGLREEVIKAITPQNINTKQLAPSKVHPKVMSHPMLWMGSVFSQQIADAAVSNRIKQNT